MQVLAIKHHSMCKPPSGFANLSRYLANKRRRKFRNAVIFLIDTVTLLRVCFI